MNTPDSNQLSQEQQQSAADKKAIIHSGIGTRFLNTKLSESGLPGSEEAMAYFENQGRMIRGTGVTVIGKSRKSADLFKLIARGLLFSGKDVKYIHLANIMALFDEHNDETIGALYKVHNLFIGGFYIERFEKCYEPRRLQDMEALLEYRRDNSRPTHVLCEGNPEHGEAWWGGDTLDYILDTNLVVEGK